MKMNERQLCRFIEEWTATRYPEWVAFQRSVNDSKRTGIYTITGGTQLLLIIDSVIGNMENYFGLERGHHLIPSRFSSPRQLMRFLSWFRDYAEKGLEFLRNIPDEEQDRYEVQHTYEILDHVYEFADCCIEAYGNAYMDESFMRLGKIMRDCLEQKDVAGFIEALQSIYTDIPYPIHKEKLDEAFFHSIAQAVLYQMGFRVCSEKPNNLGRLDMLIEMKKIVYIFEFKYSEDGKDRCDEALKQINDKHYADPYLATGRTVIGVGVTFGQEAKNIIYYKDKKLTK